MDVERFAPAQRHNVVTSERGYRAYVPPPLPPVLRVDADLVRRLSSADRALGELAGMGRTIPNPHLLSQTLMRREAVLSSRIEGTQASLSDLVIFEAEGHVGADAGDVREVHNYVAAVEHVTAADRRLPLSLPLLREAHGILMQDVRGGHGTPGEFRRSPNWIGPPGCTIDDATYVPPPPERLWECLDAFEKHLHIEQQLPPLVTVATVHYQFEAIHPFLDGNGRIGRLLVILLLIDWGLLPAPLLDLSAYIEPRRDRYYDSLLRVSTDGDWAGWLSFFLETVEEQARDATRRATRLHRLRDDYRHRVSTARSSASLGVLVDELFRVPALTIRRARERLGVTHRAATLTLEKLVAAGILSEVEDKARRRLFIATEVIRALDDAT